MGTQVEVPPTALIARRLSFSSNETQHVTATLNRYTAPPEKCYDIERQLLSLKERLRPLRFKLKHTLAKRLICERVMAGGHEGYDSMIPQQEDIEDAQEKLKAIRQDKNSLREENAAMTREIGALIEQIEGCQHDLQETLRELASFGDNSPYAPNQAASNSLAANSAASAASEEDLEKTIKIALLKLESRIHEIEEHQRTSQEASGFQLTYFSDKDATFEIDWERIVKMSLSDPETQIPAFLQSCGLKTDPESLNRFWVKLTWTTSCELIGIEVPIFENEMRDIFESAIEDNSPSFALREISRRLYCLVQRYSDLNEFTVMRPKGSLMTSPFEISLDFALSDAPDYVIGLTIPLEYPSSCIKIAYVVDPTGVVLYSPEGNRSERFDSIVTAFDKAATFLSSPPSSE